MEEESGQLNDWISNLEKKRPFTSSLSAGKKSANTMRNNTEVIESFGALSLGDGTHAEGSSCSPIKQAPIIQPKKSTQSQKKRFVKAPSECIKKFNIDDLRTNNYKAIEAVIKDILATKSKSSAKKSKAKTDVRPKALDGSGLALDPKGLYNEAEVDKNVKDMKPKSAQPRNYRHYYKKEVPELQGAFVPKSLSDLNRIYEDATKNIHNLNVKKTVPKRKVTADKVMNTIIEKNKDD